MLTSIEFADFFECIIFSISIMAIVILTINLINKNSQKNYKYKKK